MRNEIIFYNGFNLLVDILVACIAGYFAYRAGWFRGYGEGSADERERWEYDTNSYYADAHADYLAEQYREEVKYNETSS